MVVTGHCGPDSPNRAVANSAIFLFPICHGGAHCKRLAGEPTGGICRGFVRCGG